MEFQTEHDSRIWALHQAGKKPGEIGAELGLKPLVVGRMLSRLKRADEPMAEVQPQVQQKAEVPVKSEPAAEAGPTLEWVRVEVQKSPEMHVVKAVLRHEVALLELLHGNGSVRVLATRAEVMPQFSVSQEYARLGKLYRSNDGKPGVLSAMYPTVQALGQAIGIPVDVYRARNPNVTIEEPGWRSVA